MHLELIVSTNLKLLKVGGAIVGNSTDIAKSFYHGKMLPGSPRVVIVISTHLKRNLTLDEFKAVYYHELGHHVLGHLKSNIKCTYIAAHELAADAYAAKQIGANHVLSALEKVPNIIKSCKSLRKENTIDKTDDQYSDQLNLKLNHINSQMLVRYKALKILCDKQIIKE